MPFYRGGRYQHKRRQPKRFGRRRTFKKARSFRNTAYKRQNNNVKRFVIVTQVNSNIANPVNTDVVANLSQMPQSALWSAQYQKYRVKSSFVQIKPTAGFPENRFDITTGEGFMTSWKDPTNSDGALTSSQVALNKAGAIRHPTSGFTRRSVPVAIRNPAGTLGNQLGADTYERSWINTENDEVDHRMFRWLMPTTAKARAQTSYTQIVWFTVEFTGRKV